MDPKVTRSMREATFNVAPGGAHPGWGEETLWACVAAGLMTCVDGAYETTPAGDEVALAEQARREERRK
ncbi:MAG TPA: hypothetical protein VMT47_11730, partial [Polyangia bacterium]|nr:hypothetical protein [Polyangia bacterium]